MKRKIIGFFKDDDGVTAIEYGLIAALIAVGIIASVILLGTNLRDTFSYVGSHVDGAGS